jgi:tRNA-dihydrouridine synthase B
VIIPVVGNGDVDSAEKAALFLAAHKVDGIMIGRAAIGNPWIFKQCRDFISKGIYPQLPSLKERSEVCLQHLKLAIELKGESRAINEMRKHYTNYFKGIPGIKIFRNRLVTALQIKEVHDIVAEILDFYANESV